MMLDVLDRCMITMLVDGELNYIQLGQRAPAEDSQLASSEFF